MESESFKFDVSDVSERKVRSKERDGITRSAEERQGCRRKRRNGTKYRGPHRRTYCWSQHPITEPGVRTRCWIVVVGVRRVRAVPDVLRRLLRRRRHLRLHQR